MAGDWIKMTTSLHENPHVVEMAEILELDELHVIGMLWRVWAWADEQTTSHTGVNTTERRINKMVGCSGFCEALRQVGWLEGEDKNLSFPNFDEHNGTTAKNRALGRNRNQKYRNSKGCDGENTIEETPCDASCVTPLDNHVTQEASLDGASPEKRREEKSMRVRGNSTVNNAPKRGSAPLPQKSRSGLLSVPIGELEPFAAWVKSLREGWCIGKMTQAELADLEKAYLSLSKPLHADDEVKIRRYFDEMPANGSKWDYPPDRALFLASFAEIVQKAFAWWKRMKYKTPSEIQAIKEKTKPVASEPPMTEEERAEALKELREMKQECV